MKKWLLYAVLGALCLTAWTAAAAGQEAQKADVHFVPMKFIFDGKQYAPPEDQQGFIYLDHTYVPVRFIAHVLGKEVDWNGEAYTVAVRNPDRTELVRLQDYVLNREIRGAATAETSVAQQPVPATSIPVYFRQVSYNFDGEERSPEAELPGLIYNDRTYVPMRFFSEALGQEIAWDGATYTVSSQSPAYVEQLRKQEELASAPKPTTPPPGTPSTGGSGGGGGPTAPAVPTYHSIVNSYTPKIENLRNRAETYFFGLLVQAANSTPEQIEQLQAQGQASMAGFDAEFDGLMASLKAELSHHKFDTAIVAEYYALYAEEKKLAEQLIK